MIADESGCKPLITVGVSTYNRKDYLIESLKSIEAQTLTDFEIIVVDDGSTDGTEAMMREMFPHVKYIYQQNAGDAAAKNTAAAHASGKYLVFNDSDDLFLPDALERLYEPLKKCPDGVSYGRYITIDAEGKRLPTKGKVAHYPSGYILPDLLTHILVNNTATMMPLAIFREIGGYDETLRGTYDYKFALELACRSTFFAVEEPVFLRRRHGGNLSAGNYNKQHVVLDVFENFLTAHPGVQTQYPKQVRRRRADLHSKLAREAKKQSLGRDIIRKHLKSALCERFSLRTLCRYLGSYFN